MAEPVEEEADDVVVVVVVVAAAEGAPERPAHEGSRGGALARASVSPEILKSFSPSPALGERGNARESLGAEACGRDAREFELRSRRDMMGALRRARGIACVKTNRPRVHVW